MQINTHRLSTRFVFWLVFLLLPISQASADSSVWKISDGDDHIFLGGTVHLLSKSDFPLPDEFSEAYDASDLVVFETDIAAMADPAIMQSMMAKMSYTDGSSIRDHLAPKTIEALETHLSQRGLSLDQFATFKPSMLYLVLNIIELQVMGIDVAGVDVFYSEKASADNKDQLMLESIDEQIDYLVSIGVDNPDKLIEYFLRDIASLKNIMDGILEAWRNGDAESLSEIMIEFMANDYPKIYQNLLVNRNLNWLPSITGYFDTDEIEFVLVGVGHLVGDTGLLKLLEDDGYIIEQL